MLTDRFQSYVERHGLFSRDDRILLTVSGGVDSMVLLSLMASLGYRFGVAHCNFQLRGAESDEDEVTVAREAARYGVPCYNRRFDTAAEMERTGESMEMAARRLRYAWFDALSREHGYTAIAIAHHADDSIETFFINLLRGTGLRGLTGISTQVGKVIRPLLSRCQLYVLKSLEKDDLLELLQRAVTTDVQLKERQIELRETTAMLRYSGGDARKLLNILDLVVQSEAGDPVVITDEMVTERLQQNPLAYDKDGEMHYDIISAFIKSIRGSDPDGAIYWLARMVEGGEAPAFIARRLVISASEDIGLANPNALLLANACFDTIMKVGWPEGRIPLAETTIYLATSPKSNSAYMAINDALSLVRPTGNLPGPQHQRTAPPHLMKQLG